MNPNTHTTTPVVVTPAASVVPQGDRVKVKTPVVPKTPTETKTLRLRSFDEIEAVPYRWLWFGYLAIGQLTMFGGDPNNGKSLVSIDVAARLTRGWDFPDGAKNEMDPCEVLLLTVEEDVADTIKPRFIAAGGDTSKLFWISLGSTTAAKFDITKKLTEIEAMLDDRAGNIRLIIIDPTIDFLDVEANKDEKVRGALTELVGLLKKKNISGLGIHHFNKNTEQAVIYRMSGARGWMSVARLNYMFGIGEDGKTFHICPIKNNIIARKNASLDFDIVVEKVNTGKIKDKLYPRVSWLGQGSMTAEDLTALTRPKTDRDRAEPAVETWLREQLADGEWKPARKIIEAGAAAGYGEKQLQRARKSIMGEWQKTKTTPAQVEWRLPDLDKDLGLVPIVKAVQPVRGLCGEPLSEAVGD